MRADKEKAIRALEKGGIVNPQDLIAAARDPNHPCHDDFTWDVGEAAKERWRDQARALIRACKFTVLYEDIEYQAVEYVPSSGDDPVFVSLPKMRPGKSVAALMAAELQQLVGNVARVRGIALAKRATLGDGIPKKLGTIGNMVSAMLAELE